MDSGWIISFFRKVFLTSVHWQSLETTTRPLTMTIQILESKCHFPLKETRTPWKNKIRKVNSRSKVKNLQAEHETPCLPRKQKKYQGLHGECSKDGNWFEGAPTGQRRDNLSIKMNGNWSELIHISYVSSTNVWRHQATKIIRIKKILRPLGEYKACNSFWKAVNKRM